MNLNFECTYDMRCMFHIQAKNYWFVHVKQNSKDTKENFFFDKYARTSNFNTG